VLPGSPVVTQQTPSASEPSVASDTQAPDQSLAAQSVLAQIGVSATGSALDPKLPLSLLAKSGGQTNEESPRLQIVRSASQSTIEDSTGNSSALSTKAAMPGTEDGNTLADYAFALRVQTAKQFQATAAIGQMGFRESASNANPAVKQTAETSADKSTSESDGFETKPQAARSAAADTAHQNEHSDTESASSADTTKVATSQEQIATPHDAATQSQTFPAAVSDTFATSASSAQSVTGDQTSSTPAAASEPPVSTAQEPATGAMKQLSVRVESAAGESVDVRIVQRAGELHVAVKGADGDITQNLRHGLSDLASRLNDGGYRTETWRGDQAGSANAASNQSSQQQSSRDGNSQSGNPNSGNSSQNQQNQNQRDGNRNSSGRPHWIEELESSLAGAASPTGQSPTI
jgi:hypothetical protein